VRNYFRTLLYELKIFKYFVVLHVGNSFLLIVQHPGMSQSLVRAPGFVHLVFRRKLFRMTILKQSPISMLL